MKEVLPSGLLFLEGKDGRECCKHFKNCVPCHSSIEGTVYPELAIVRLCFCVISVNVVGTWHA